MKSIIRFSSENYHFTAVKNCSILHRRVFVIGLESNCTQEFGWLIRFLYTCICIYMDVPVLKSTACLKITELISTR